MKKRYLIFLMTALAVVIAFVMPSFVQRTEHESLHKQYSVAIELSSALDGVAQQDRAEVLDMYRNNGADFALLTEKDGSFNTEYGRIAKESGLRIALAVFGGEEKSSGYGKMLRQTIDELEAEYIVIKNINKNNKPGHGDMAEVARVISDCRLTLVLSEYGKTQLSNEKPAGIDQCIAAADGRLMRSYETQQNPRSGLSADSGKSSDSELVYHQMHNSATDRNTEFLIVNRLNAPKLSVMENTAETANAISRFCDKADSSGYIKGGSPNLKAYRTPGPLTCGSAALVGVLMCLWIVNMIRRKSCQYFDWIMYAISIVAFGVTAFLPEALISLYPTLFAVIAPCFCLCLCYRMIQNRKSLASGITAGLITALVSMLICAVIQCSMLSGAQYYLNIAIFRGVKLTLVVPMIFAVILPLVADKEKGMSGINHKAFINVVKSIRLRHIALLIPVALIGMIYIMRSGNAQISETENTIRNFISELWNARPRTKEFLVGWPCLVLLAIAVHRKASLLLCLIFTAGSSILFASVSNTFCHVFTDAAISFSRTLNGFAMGVPFMIVFGALGFPLIKLCSKFLK